MNIMRLSLLSLSFALLLAFSASEVEAMFHKKKERKEKTQQVCMEAATRTCNKTASDECSGKSGFKKDLCEKTSRRACLETSKAACEKKAG
jgi:hypothetical protein